MADGPEDELVPEGVPPHDALVQLLRLGGQREVEDVPGGGNPWRLGIDKKLVGDLKKLVLLAVVTQASYILGERGWRN